MKKLAIILLVVGLCIGRASANPYLLLLPFAITGAQIASTLGPPLTAMTGYGICHTPSVHIFGTENTTVGLDWSSFGSRSRNVYGLQMSLCGGGFAEDLYGVEMSLLACGWVNEYDISMCHMNGIEIAPFAVKTAMANGFQVCPVYSKAKVVNGLQLGGFYAQTGLLRGMQCGLVNSAIRTDGLQIGLYNATRYGHFLQIGLLNCVYRRNVPVLPLINAGFR